MSMLGCIHRNLTVLGNAGSGLDNLHSFTLPAGSLSSNGDYLKVRYSGSFAANVNSKRIQANFAGQVAVNNALVQNVARWDYDITYVRLTSTTVIVTGQFMWNFASPVGGFINSVYGAVFAGVSPIVVPDLNINDAILLVQAEGVADNDIVQNLSLIEISQQ